ncbi:MAG: ATP-dependent DNA helicase RecG [Candidatus Omnitrophota bacterium]|jgi:ATP-dependent DNA helicase RecG|nr:MAG: ATP-dependent DNA helicase RecG [Candidatus Omnitrophota bacterium]
MEAIELIEIINRGEDTQHQFKENFTNADSLAAEMTALSNSHGGEILIGVNDRGEIVGLSSHDIKRLNQLISNTASQCIKNAINPKTENVSIGDKVVMVVTILKGTDKPYMDNKGNIWVKSGSDKRKVTSREEMRRFFQESDIINADKVPVEGSTINDIDIRYFEQFFQRNYGKDLNQIEISLFQLLENMNLAKNGQLNLAGLLLFGKTPQWKKPEFIVKAVSFYGNDPTTIHYRDSEDISGNLKYMFDTTISFLTRNLHKLQNDKGFNSLGDIEISRETLDELVVNMLIHRDYFISAPWRIFIFDNRIEIISPGRLPNNLTVENIKAGISTIRNPVIASFATKELPYRGLGTGILRALKYYPDIDFINDCENNQFICSLRRKECDGL